MNESCNSREYLSNLLGALSLAVTDLQGEAIDTLGRPRADSEALLAVHSHPSATVKDVAYTTGLSHSGAVRVLDRLTGLDWIRRIPGVDRRTVELHCTSAGSERALQLLDSRNGVLMAALSRLSDEDAARLQEVLELLLASLADGRAAAWRICRLCDHRACQREGCPVGAAIS